MTRFQRVGGGANPIANAADKWSVEGALKRCDGSFPLQKEEYNSIP